STNYGTTWTHPNSNAVLSIAAHSQFDTPRWFAVKTNNTVWSVVGTTWTQITGITNASKVAVDNNGYVLVVGTNGNVYVLDDTTGAWTKLAGTGNTAIANGEATGIWTLGATVGSNNTYRLSTKAMHHARTMSGYATCGQLGCQGVTHNAHLRA